MTREHLLGAGPIRGLKMGRRLVGNWVTEEMLRLQSHKISDAHRAGGVLRPPSTRNELLLQNVSLGRIKKGWCPQAMEHDSATETKETLSFVTTREDLDGVLLSEVSQTEKDKYHMVSLVCGI